MQYNTIQYKSELNSRCNALGFFQLNQARMIFDCSYAALEFSSATQHKIIKPSILLKKIDSCTPPLKTFL